jgi:hypothetical protein
MKSFISLFIGMLAFMPIAAFAQDTPLPMGPEGSARANEFLSPDAMPPMYNQMMQHHQLMHGEDGIAPFPNSNFANQNFAKNNNWEGGKKGYAKDGHYDDFMDFSSPWGIATMIGMLVVHAILWLIFLIVSVFVARKVWDYAGKKREE